MNIVVVGTGYVGLVTGTCFAEVGNHVICVDTNPHKIEALKQGRIPIYEPGLEPMVLQNYAQKRLAFSTSLPEVLNRAEICFIAVGTPPEEDGSADLSHVVAVARQIGQHLSRPMIVIDKSTVPVGTGEMVRDTIQQELDKRGEKIAFQVISNPEFLKEGAAISDFMRPDRVVIGCDRTPEGKAAGERVAELYQPITRNHERTLIMGIREAEMTKYVANCMLATKLSFINEMAALCDSMKVDVEDVRKGIGSDSRIGFSFIYPGCGYGGSCFPKDVKALINMAEKAGVEPIMLNAVEERNAYQKEVLFEKIAAYFAATGLAGKTFAIWGLAFKPGTDDVREASSLVLIEKLIKAGASIVAYDPVALETAQEALSAEVKASGRIRFVNDQDEALKGADALAIVTEWKSFRSPDFDLIKQSLKSPVIFDGRNLYSPERVRLYELDYIGIGRRNV